MIRPITAIQRLILAAALAGLLTACEGGVLDRGVRFLVVARPMETGDVETLYTPGLVFTMEWADGTTGTMSFGEDGDLRVAQGERTARGHWYVVDNRVCTDYGAPGGMCYVTYHRKDYYRMFDANGSLFADARKTG